MEKSNDYIRGFGFGVRVVYEWLKWLKNYEPEEDDLDNKEFMKGFEAAREKARACCAEVVLGFAEAMEAYEKDPAKRKAFNRGYDSLRKSREQLVEEFLTDGF